MISLALKVSFFKTLFCEECHQLSQSGSGAYFLAGGIPLETLDSRSVLQASSLNTAVV